MNPETSSSPSKFKIVFVGDISVGKTSILNRFTYDNFQEEYQATIGIDFVTKSITVNNQTIKLQLWDTAGQEKFRSLIPTYIKDSSMAVIAFDLTEKKSFESIQMWSDSIKPMRSECSLTMLVGNKLDLENKRAVSYDEGKSKCEEIKADYYIETSAKSGNNIKEMFSMIGELLVKKSKENTPTPPPQPNEHVTAPVDLKPTSTEAPPKKKCC